MSKAVKKTTKKVAKKTTKAKVYNVTVINLGRKYKGKGKTPLEALENVEINAVGGKSIVVMECGKNKLERIIPHLRSRRTFTTKGMTRDIQLQLLSKLFSNV